MKIMNFIEWESNWRNVWAQPLLIIRSYALICIRSTLRQKGKVAKSKNLISNNTLFSTIFKVDIMMCFKERNYGEVLVRSIIGMWKQHDAELLTAAHAHSLVPYKEIINYFSWFVAF